MQTNETCVTSDEPSGDYSADRWTDQWLAHPTSRSIAAARAAQRRERLAITEATGVRINQDGQPVFRLSSRANLLPDVVG